MIVRPVRSSDLPALMALAQSTGTGLTTLPANEERLSHRVSWAEKTFRGEAERADADYLFVMENDDGEVVGISAVAGAVGKREPWYNFRVGLTVSASQELGIHREIPTLFLANDLTGHSELCSLFLHADHRSGLNGRLLSKARFMFIAEFRELFGDKVIAEMRGMSDADGRSPFWESLGRHFFKMDFAQADFLSYVGSKSFIAELMPKYPIYTCLLSDEAQAVIGHVHPATAPARAMLESEGFAYQGYIDIFDAGPSLACQRDNIRAVRESRIYQTLTVAAEPKNGTPWLVSNGGLADFRATIAITRPLEDSLPLTSAVLARLNLDDGASVRAVPLSAKG